MLELIAALTLGQPPVLTPPPVADPPPVRAGSGWVPEKKKKLTPAESLYVESVQTPVSNGQTVWVAIGEDYPDVRRDDRLEAVMGKGVFVCNRENGVNVMRRVIRQEVVYQQPRPILNAVQQFVEQRPVLNLLTSPLSGGT
jgi:hypothetical protein